MRRQIEFPDPRSAGDDGLLCVGGDLEIDTLRIAYGQGIFPWPQEGLPLLWFSPLERGVLDFAEVHWPRRFLRGLRSLDFEIRFNTDFYNVIRQCAKQPRAHEPGTWILPEMQNAYSRFHEAGFAHSVEAWQGDELVGGLYGVFVNGVFSGESMFHKVTDAGKVCLFHLIESLQAAGIQWMDIQMVTPVLETFGGKYISREEFLARLDLVHENPVSLSLR